MRTEIMSPLETPRGWLDPGDVVKERYRIVERLGEGGMGAVYSAHDLELDDVVAIKVLKPTAGGETLSRFKREIRIARRVLHPNVCRTYSFDSWGELKFIIMELVPGRTLKSLMQDPDWLDLAAKLALFDGILAGLGAAHELGIIHRDMKPENVMITDEQRPVIMDFGIAQELESSGLTLTGNIIGTIEYMAPERLLKKNIDQRSDIYSMGVILFELVTGQRPFSGDSIFQVAQAHISRPAPRPSELNPEVPPWLEDVILKMLVKQPQGRAQSITEVMAQLAAHGDLETRQPRVLVIDDDDDFLALAQQHLAHGGVEVLTARSGSEGIEQVLSTGVDLVCLEFSLPDMDGFDVAIHLQMLNPEQRIPVFMVTSIHDPQYVKQASRVGIDKVFTKPLDVETFLMEVAEQLGI